MTQTRASVAPHSTAPLEIATLLGIGDLELSIRCLRSFVRLSSTPVTLRIHEDGTLDTRHRQLLSEHLPIARFVTRPEADRRSESLLKDLPHCQALRSRNPLALKLFDIHAFESSDQVSYVDSDLLFLRPYETPFASRSTGDSIFFPDSETAYSLRSWELFGRKWLSLPRRINTGLIRFPRAAFDFHLIERLLGEWSGFAPVWIEQTCWAVLAAGTRARLLSPKQAKIFHDGLGADPELLVLHFVSPVRSALRTFCTSPQQEATSPREFQTVPAKSLTPLELGFIEARRVLRRGRDRLRPAARVPA